MLTESREITRALIRATALAWMSPREITACRDAFDGLAGQWSSPLLRVHTFPWPADSRPGIHGSALPPRRARSNRTRLHALLAGDAAPRSVVACPDRPEPLWHPAAPEFASQGPGAPKGPPAAHGSRYPACFAPGLVASLGIARARRPFFWGGAKCEQLSRRLAAARRVPRRLRRAKVFAGDRPADRGPNGG